MKTYPKKEKKSYIPRFNSVNGIVNSEYVADQLTKKTNAANFMKDEEFAKSKYATMSADDFAIECKKISYNSISW